MQARETLLVLLLLSVGMTAQTAHQETVGTGARDFLDRCRLILLEVETVNAGVVWADASAGSACPTARFC